jgi:hypothetical protein
VPLGEGTRRVDGGCNTWQLQRAGNVRSGGHLAGPQPAAAGDDAAIATEERRRRKLERVAGFEAWVLARVSV